VIGIPRFRRIEEGQQYYDIETGHGEHLWHVVWSGVVVDKLGERCHA
jgi:hypothetical protein